MCVSGYIYDFAVTFKSISCTVTKVKTAKFLELLTHCQECYKFKS